MSSRFGMATVCPPGSKPNKRWKGKRGQKQCIKSKTMLSLKKLQAIARANGVNIYKRRCRSGFSFTKKPLSVKALSRRLALLNISHFGMATVCRPGYKQNNKWKGKRGQKQCIKSKTKKVNLKKLQALARANEVSVYKRRKDGMGFTRTPLTAKALKGRLTRMRVSYK